ncbi:MAG: Crp/Fnr family transcriptional regulator [Flavobacteriales bacterium]|nr:Crp/Fnr family transcriptional regulator [Flavobacteriales bacterium]
MHQVRAAISRYVELSDRAWSAFEPKWKRFEFQKGELVSQAGRTEDRFGVMVEGVHKLYHLHEGVEHIVGFSYDGSWTGVYDSFVAQRPARFELVSLGSSAAYMIGYRDLQEAYDHVPGMDRFGRLILEELLLGRATREIEQLSLSAEDRFLRFMERSAHLLQLVPQKDIASYLRMTPETFSRLRAKAV